MTSPHVGIRDEAERLLKVGDFEVLQTRETKALIRALLAELDRQGPGVWRPIESAPKDGTHVWLWNGYRRCIGWYSEYQDASGGWHRQSLIGEPLGRRDIDPETHWQPLPPAPSQESR